MQFEIKKPSYGQEVFSNNFWGNKHNEIQAKLCVKKANSQDYRLLAKYSKWLMTCHYINEPIRLNDFQISFVDCMDRSTSLVKARQLGFSFCAAGRAVAKSHIKPKSTNIFVSYNLREAKEKIEIARTIAAGVPKKIKKKIKPDNQLELGFDNGSRIISLFTPRGYAHADVYLDEFAFYENQRDIYNAALPVATSPRYKDTQLFIGSSPFGKIGLFYDIINGTDGKYQNYAKHFWFWWDSPFCCNDVASARLDAHYMTTSERVNKYATDSFYNDTYSSMLEEDFQQEFECYFCDESKTFFPYDIIKHCMSWYDITDQETFPTELEEIRLWVRGILYAGFDVGRTHDTSEFYVFDYRSINKAGMEEPELVQVFHKSMDKTKFKDQKNFLIKFLKMYQDCIGCLHIDRNQIGMNIAEDLEDEFPGMALGMDFTNASKERMAVTTKMFMTEGILKLFPDRETLKQIHSVRQLKTTSGVHTKFDVEDTKEHHADRFWSIALAVDASNTVSQIKPEICVIRGDVKDKNSWNSPNGYWQTDYKDFYGHKKCEILA